MAIVIKGNWKKGYALDLHTVSSECIGEDQFGHKQFDTKYTKIGEYVNRLKYKSDRTVVPKIVDEITKIFGTNMPDVIIPAPPSRIRLHQPVFEIANALGERIDVRVLQDKIVKQKSGLQLKNITDSQQRKQIASSICLTEEPDITDMRVLVLDDLYQSGSTLRAVTELLYSEAKVKEVYVICMTKTRTKR